MYVYICIYMYVCVLCRYVYVCMCVNTLYPLRMSHDLVLLLNLLWDKINTNESQETYKRDFDRWKETCKKDGWLLVHVIGILLHIDAYRYVTTTCRVYRSCKRARAHTLTHTRANTYTHTHKHTLHTLSLSPFTLCPEGADSEGIYDVCMYNQQSTFPLYTQFRIILV